MNYFKKKIEQLKSVNDCLRSDQISAKQALKLFEASIKEFDNVEIVSETDFLKGEINNIQHIIDTNKELVEENIDLIQNNNSLKHKLLFNFKVESLKKHR